MSDNEDYEDDDSESISNSESEAEETLPMTKSKKISKFFANERSKHLVTESKKSVSAYLAFTAYQRPILKASDPNISFQQLTKTLGTMWGVMTHLKVVYKTCAKVCLERNNCKLVEIKIFGSNICPSIYKYLANQPIKLNS